MTIRLKIILTLALIIPVMVVFISLFHIAQKKNEEQSVGIAHSYQVIDQIDVLVSDMQDAETGKRGFIITNNKSFLEPYARSIQKVDTDLAQLREMTQDNPTQQKHLNEFEPVMRNSLSYMAETIALTEEQGLQAAVKRVSAKTGKALMDRMRTILGNMINEEQRLVAEQKKNHSEALAAIYKGEAVFIFTISAIAFIMGFVLIRSIMWPLNELNRGAKKLGAGKYATRLNFLYQDEFNELAKTFNLMAEAVQIRTQELDGIVSTMADGLIIMDSQGAIRSLNPAAERMFDYTVNELMDKHVNQLLPLFYDDIKRQDGSVSSGYRSELNGKRKDGSLLPLELALSEMVIDGKYMFNCLLRDVSVQKNAQMALLNNEARLSAVIETVVEGIITIDSKGTVETMNPAAERIFAYQGDEVIGNNINMLMPEPYHSQHDGYLLNYLTTGKQKVIGIGREVVGRRKDGSVFPMELAVSEMSIDSKRMFTGLVRDISTQKNAQMAIINKEARLRAIIETVVEGIITIDSKGTVETMNPAAERIFAYQGNEVIGNNINMLMPEPYHSQHDGYLLNYLTTGQQKIIGIGREVVGRRKDGSLFPMELAVSEMSIDGKRMFTGLVRNISERKAMEQMKNEFISTVSHELRTPLTSIQGSLGLVLGGATGELPEKSIKLLTIASNNCKRLVRLINDILDLEKFESGKMAFDIKPLEIMPLVTHAIESNQAYADEFGVTFVITHEQPGAIVLADHDRLTQVLTNLLSNAAKFSHRGGQVEVAISNSEKRLRLSVTDYGTGIKEEFRGRIFKKFTQEDATNTRQKGGTGLGLSISKAIIEKMDGVIDFESEPDKKTTFFFELPLYHAEKALSVTSSGDRNKEHLLILEDDPDIANLLRLMLEKNGYSADIAYNTELARQMLNSKAYDAMTLDVMLPGQSGIDFFRELHSQELFKDLPIIIVSALVDQAKKELNGDAVDVVDWLSKPIDEERLEQAVTHAFRRNGTTPRILHVEDDPDIVHIVGTLLQQTAQVDVAMNLATAREKLRQDYDLVILDMGLPDGSGESLLPLIANRAKAIPVVIFSANEINTSDNQRVFANLIKSKTSNEIFMNKIEAILASKRK